VHRGLERLAASGATGALVVAHKGVLCEIVSKLTGARPAAGHPALGAAIVLTRAADGSWRTGSRSSNPEEIAVPMPVEVAR
jgi:hypothetical protein